MPNRRLAHVAPLLAAAVWLAAGPAGGEDFARVGELLKTKCAGCHGDDAEDVRAELDVRSRKGLLRGGESEEPALVPGNPEKSPLYVAVTWEDDALQMPPKENDRLTPEEVALVRRWIQAGAPWPEPRAKPDEAPKTPAGWSQEPGENGIVIPTTGGQSAEWTYRRYQPEDVWAYRPVRRPAVPSDGLGPTATANPIDTFVRAKLNEHGVPPAPPADRPTLIRRLTLDLTGLLPTPEEIEAFLADNSPDAYDRLVDRLLTSPRYGEQRARHWLDVVRYADTGGFANDFERANAWRYRDYVIRSFNRDKPYDRFVTEQLAGDELEEPTPETLIAVGFLRMGPWEHTGMSVAAVTRQQFLDDVTHSVGVTFLGQGLRCARCHDHKFDPIPTRDYYRVQAVFAPVEFADRRVEYQPWENTSRFAEMKTRTEGRLRRSQDYVASVRRKHERAVAKYLKEKGVESVDRLPPDQRPRGGFFGLSPLEMSLEKMHRKRIAYHQREMKRYEPYAFSVYSGPPRDYTSQQAVHPMPPPEKRQGKAADVFILPGGALESPGEKVTPGVLSAMAAPRGKARMRPASMSAIPETIHGRRLALARWVASEENTLTARVMVNRVWQWHFGRGLVATPNNFGKMGVRPTHPELLDWLAAWFVEHGWSVKALDRLIVTSATYQQSGRNAAMEKVVQTDPKNDLLAYFPPRRLAAEEIRDAMLAAAGELNPEMGGPGVRPEIHWEVAFQPRHVMGTVAPPYQPSPRAADRHRRTIYAFRMRTLADPMLEVFNRPGSDTSCERRDETTVAPQAFALLNGQFVHARALALARRLDGETSDPGERVDRAFRLVYGRPAEETERQSCLDHVARMTEHHRAHEPVPVELPTLVRREMVEELTGEPFEWEEELDVMAGYERDVQPWEVEPETRAWAEVCLVLFNSNEFLYVR